MNSIIPRIKLVIANYGPAIAALLVITGLLAFGGAAWTLTHPPTVEQTEQVASTTIGTDVRTSTVVTGNTTLWERGTYLEDKPVYPLQSAPNLTVHLQTTVPEGKTVEVSQELTLVYRATKDDNVVFWRAGRPLVNQQTTVTDGEAVSSATMDMRQVRTELDEINGEVTGIGTAQAYLLLNVSYDTGQHQGQLSKTAPLAVLQSGYWVGGSLDAEETHVTPVTKEVPQPPDRQKAFGFGLLGILSFSIAGGILYTYSSRIDQSAVAKQIDQSRYEEWISEGRIGHMMSGQDISMDSLQDLVDVAIDSKKRVVFDTERELYAVVGEGVIYYYDPFERYPELDIESELTTPVTPDGGGPALRARSEQAADQTEEASSKTEMDSDESFDPWDQLMDQ